MTLTGSKLHETVYEVMLPTPDGQIAVFPGHEPLVTLAVPGVVAVRRAKDDSDDQLEYFAISGGVVEISQTKVRILVDEAEHGAISLRLRVKPPLSALSSSATTLVPRWSSKKRTSWSTAMPCV